MREKKQVLIFKICSPLRSSGLTTRGSDWANPGDPKLEKALSYNLEPRAWCKSVYTFLWRTFSCYKQEINFILKETTAEQPSLAEKPA